MVGHVEHLVQVSPQGRDLSLELMDAVAVAHVFREVVKPVHPVVEGAGDQHHDKRHQADSPQRDPVDMEDRPADVNGPPVAVAEDRRRDTDEKAHQKRAGKKEPLPEVGQVAHRPKVTRFARRFTGFANPGVSGEAPGSVVERIGNSALVFALVLFLLASSDRD